MTHKQRLSLMLMVAFACYAALPGRASGQHTPPPATQPSIHYSTPGAEPGTMWDIYIPLPQATPRLPEPPPRISSLSSPSQPSSQPPPPQPVPQQSAPSSTGSLSQVPTLPVQVSETPPVPVRTHIAATTEQCAEQYTKCQDRGGSCSREVDPGKSLCAQCLDLCKKDSTTRACRDCGFE